MTNRGLRLGFILMAFFTLVQCDGPQTISNQIKFEVIPKSPIVILSDFTLNPGDTDEKKISGPWFLLNYSITNNSEETITVQSLLFKVTAVTTTGQIKESIVTIDPADYEDQLGHEPFYLLEVAPLTSATPTFGLYISGLEKDVISYTYSVQVDVQGWVGTPSEPIDRLVKFANFSTK